jgi:hypothetical protein
MIEIENGEFKLDEYKFIIHPELVLSQFRTGDIPIQTTEFNKVTDFTNLTFCGGIDGLKAQFTILFKGEHLHELRFEQEGQQAFWDRLDRETKAASKNGWEAELAAIRKWGKILADAGRLQKQQNDEWLVRVIGGPPPYEYDWGFIASFQDPKQDYDAVIRVEFKYSFLDRGFPDLKSSLEARTRDWKTMMEGIENEAKKISESDQGSRI